MKADGKSHGFGFVTFKHEEAAEHYISKFPMINIKLRTAKIKADTRTQEQKQSTLGLKAFYSGQLQEPTRVERNEKRRSHGGYGNQDMAQVGSSIYIGNLPWDMTSKDLKHHFSF